MLEGLNGSLGPAKSYVTDTLGISTKAAPPARLPSEPESGQITIGSRHVGAKDTGIGAVVGDMSEGGEEVRPEDSTCDSAGADRTALTGAELHAETSTAAIRGMAHLISAKRPLCEMSFVDRKRGQATKHPFLRSAIPLSTHSAQR